MPHGVPKFLRTSAGAMPHMKKKTAGPRTTSSAGASPYASDADDHDAVKMPEPLADALRRHRRLSLPFCRAALRDRDRDPAAVTLDWSIESPPIVFHGPPDESSGALVSGQMLMDVRQDSVEVDSFTASLRLRVTHKRPYAAACPECQLQTTLLRSWRLLARPPTTTLRRGRHLFPFSALLEGHLPASMDTPVVAVAYQFRAEAILVRSPGSCASVRFERCLDVKRSLPEPLYPHHSVRVFPPTNIKAGAHYDSVIHPAAANRLTLKLDGLLAPGDRPATVDLWRLKKVTWRLEETMRTVAPACPSHAPCAEAARKGVLRCETRVLGEKQLHDGWKSDFTGSDGTVDLELDYCLNQYAPKPHSRHLKYACDMKTPDGTEVTHSLLIELIVSKEYAPEGKTHLAVQTGTGRILRMHFAVVLTEFPGLGVSWDNEAPPVYQDVPPRPPGYPCGEPRGPPVEYEALDAVAEPTERGRWSGAPRWRRSMETHGDAAS